MVKYAQLPKINKKHFIILISIFIALDLLFVWLFRPANMGNSFEISFTAPSEINNFLPVQFNYGIINKSNKNKVATAKLFLCDVSNENCLEFWQKQLKLKAGTNNINDEFTVSSQTQVGDRNLIFGIYEEGAQLLANQKYQPISVKNIADSLYLNLDVDRDLVVSGDFARLNYIFINKTGQALYKKDFALNLSFAGPLEKAQNTGRLIEDISQDIASNQTINGQSTFVANEYANRQGGLFDLSLFLSHRDKDGKLTPVTSVVKQIRWL